MADRPPRTPPRLPAWAQRPAAGPVRPLWGGGAGDPWSQPPSQPSAPPRPEPQDPAPQGPAPQGPEPPGRPPAAPPDPAAHAATDHGPPAATPEAPQPRAPSPAEPPAACPACEETRREADAQVAIYAQGLSQAVGNLARASVEMGMRLNLDAIALARKLAERVIQRAVELDEGLVLDNLRRAMAAAGPVERLTVRCAERDLPLLRDEAARAAAEATGRPVEVVVQAAPDLEPGSLFLLFEEGLVDARLGTQLDRLTAAVEDAVSLGAPKARQQQEQAGHGGVAPAEGSAGATAGGETPPAASAQPARPTPEDEP